MAREVLLMPFAVSPFVLSRPDMDVPDHASYYFTDGCAGDGSDDANGRERGAPHGHAGGPDRHWLHLQESRPLQGRPRGAAAEVQSAADHGEQPAQILDRAERRAEKTAARLGGVQAA